MTTLTPTEQRLVDRAFKVLEKQVKYGEREALNSPGAVRSLLRLRLAPLQHEEFHVLYLDAQNRLIEYDEMFRGTLTQTAVYPREIARGALLQNAAAVILAHNHPSGVADPSAADRLLTDQVKDVLATFDVVVLDHMIVASDRCFSFAEAGLI